jgi:hypothetical protein
MSDPKITPEELDGHDPELLPDREAMSVIRAPSPDPIGLPITEPEPTDPGE